MITDVMHVHLSLRLLTAFTVVAKYPLQSIEAPILRTLYQVNITEPPGEKNTDNRSQKNKYIWSNYIFIQIMD